MGCAALFIVPASDDLAVPTLIEWGVNPLHLIAMSGVPSRQLWLITYLMRALRSYMIYFF